MKQAVVFDLDGTLLDTLEDLANAVNRVLASHDCPTHQLDAYRYFVGDGARTLFERVLPENQRSEAMLERCLLDFRDDYGENWNIRTQTVSRDRAPAGCPRRAGSPGWPSFPTSRTRPPSSASRVSSRAGTSRSSSGSGRRFQRNPIPQEHTRARLANATSRRRRFSIWETQARICGRLLLPA